MNVLVVSQYFWPETFRINDLVEGLVERGHNVTVLTGKPNYPDGSFFPGYGFFGKMRQDYKGARVLRVPLVPRGDGRGRRLAVNYLSFVVFAGLLGPVLCRGKVDVVFVFEPSPVTVGLPAILMKRLKHAPLMFWVQDLWPESIAAASTLKSERVLNGIGHLVRYIYRRCDRVLVQSRGFVDRVESRGARPEDIIYFPNWAEKLYKPVEVEADAPEREEVPEGFRIVFAGNIGAAQSFETILAAAQKLKDWPDIHWVIVGEGRQRKWVEEQVRKLGLERQVHLIGKRPMESMPRYFALADALLVSLKRELIFSLTIPGKVQSYLACGRPMIAALDGEGARVVEEARCGATAPAEDPDALARAVLDLYEAEPEEREEMGRRARLYFEEHFERERLLDRLEGWMEELTGGKK